MAWVIFLLVLGVMGALVWASASIRSGVYLKALCEARTEERKVALTFDDGPDEEMTPRVLALLHRYRAQATFFVVGDIGIIFGDIISKHIYKMNKQSGFTVFFYNFLAAVAVAEII